MVGTGGGQDRRDGGFADVATLSGTELLDQTGEGTDLGGTDDLEEFLGVHVAPGT